MQLAAADVRVHNLRIGGPQCIGCCHTTACWMAVHVSCALICVATPRQFVTARTLPSQTIPVSTGAHCAACACFLSEQSRQSSVSLPLADYTSQHQNPLRNVGLYVNEIDAEAFYPEENPFAPGTFITRQAGSSCTSS